jgi:adenine deaminase
LDQALSKRYVYPKKAYTTVKLPLAAKAASLVPELPAAPVAANVIRTALPGIILFHDRVHLDPAASWAEHFAKHSLCFVSVLERHGKGGAVAHGLLKDFGLKAGAVASTVGHDAHNLIVAGTNEPDMRLAVETLRALRGGVCVVNKGKVVASVALPIAGLLSDLRAPAVAKETTKLKKAWLAAGCTLPYMGFNLIPLSVIPEIRITDRGLVTVPGMQILPLFEAVA